MCSCACSFKCAFDSLRIKIDQCTSALEINGNSSVNAVVSTGGISFWNAEERRLEEDSKTHRYVKLYDMI